ncbi:23S rRNA (pseudouridine(1915)-N(3))-methyltransferase RlmH [Candidatus Woesearchaeota archaeon]|nr:MAG: 23S rRNA (pseudouridine(1915)-N(3))-methyltransferase RlmH [Candidatus Woesearchaeota archaeon]
MHIRFIVVGKPSAAYRVLIADYEKRIPKYARLEVFEVKSEADIAAKVKGVLVVLDSKGKAFSSESIAAWLKSQPIVSFVIGGDTGLSESFKRQANVLLSFGAITLPHQLARLVLTEQVYRALTILKGEPYHK